MENKKKRMTLMALIYVCVLSIYAHPHVLWYDQPASHWVEALPLGNGRLGAMVYGGIESDTIQLNEDTFWSGSPYNNVNPKALGVLQDIRAALNRGDYQQAQYLSMHNITADRSITGHGMIYESVGNLVLTFPQQKVSSYHRELSLNEAVATTTYQADGISYERQVITSLTDNVTLIRLKTTHAGKLQFSASFAGPLKKQRVLADVSQVGNDMLRVFSHPTAPKEENVPNGLHCVSYIKVIPIGGKATGTNGTINVSGATEALVVVSSATNFVRYDNITADADAKAMTILNSYLDKHEPFEKSLANHVARYQEQFNRVSLDLGHNPAQEKKPTDVRIREFSETNDPGLVATYFQFGRYLLIASSQRGSQPANLQGIWNPDADQYPAWDSKYTTNINVEMNYWPAEVTNLSECHDPFLQMVKDVSVTGRRSASEMYGARGWTLHHNTDLWRSTGAVDYHSCSIWPTCNAWFCSHLWEHYLYTGDKDYLKHEAYPVMAEACRFYLDFLVREPKTGYLVASPSHSPENHPGIGRYHDDIFNNDQSPSVFAGVSMDNQMIYDLLYNTRLAANALSIDQSFADSLDQVRSQLPPMMVGKYGQLQEWLEDWDREVSNHRHVSHLWCLFQFIKHTANRAPVKVNPAAVRGIHGAVAAIADGGSLRAQLAGADKLQPVGAAAVEVAVCHGHPVAVGHVDDRARAVAGPVGVARGEALQRHVFAFHEFQHAGVARHGDDLRPGAGGADGEVLDLVDLQLPAVVVDLVPAVVLAAEHAVAQGAGEVIAAPGEGDHGIRRDGLQKFVHRGGLHFG